MKKRVRSIFISDIHLGSKHSQAKKLIKFLKEYKTQNLFLVGDIVDGWKLKKNPYWSDEFSLVFRKLLSFLKEGTNIYYVIGNHDEFLKSFSPSIYGHITVCTELVHVTAKNKRILILHGDKFDYITKNMKWLSFFGDYLYSLIINLNLLFNYFRRKLGMEHWSLSSLIKVKVKKAVNFISNFENLLSEYAKKHNCRGVICGHIHHPIIKQINEIDYYNCGDWVENCTAIIEDLNGNISLINFNNNKF